MHNFVAIGWKITKIYAIENLHSQKKWAKVHQQFFRGCYPSKTFHHAKFHRDRSNQLGVKRYLFGPSRRFFAVDGQKRDYLSRASQRTRGATKNPGIYQSNFKIFQVLSVTVCSGNYNTRHSSLTFTIHSFVTRTDLYAIQPLQCQNKHRMTYHAKNSRSDIKFPQFSRLTNFQEFFIFSRWVGTCINISQSYRIVPAECG